MVCSLSFHLSFRFVPMSNEFAAIFQEEAKELLENLEQDLLDLEESPENGELVDQVFRTMHTIKGSGAMFGFTSVADFTHHVETVLTEVRAGHIPVSHELISLVLQSRDYITSLIEDDPDEDNGALIIEQLSQLLPTGKPVETEQSSCSGEEVKLDVSSQDISLEMLQERCSVIASDLFALVGTPDDREVSGKIRDDFIFLSQGIEQLGWSDFAEFPRDVAHCIDRVMEQGGVSLPFLDLCDVARNFLVDVLKKETPPNLKSYQDLLSNLNQEVGTSSLVEKVVRSEEAEQKEEKDDVPDRIGEILVKKGHVAEGALADVIIKQKPLGEMLVDADVVTQDHIDDALEEQKKRKEIKTKKTVQTTATKQDSIRVAAEKLDVLINLVGELVVTQARLSESGGMHSDPDLIESIEDVERLTSELRECALSMRMLPIGSTFARFKRLVRDLSRDLGKDVQLLTFGAETEIDKIMLEMLADPLVHLIRNAVDHGIETPVEREARGKPAFGTISLSAVHSGPNVVVTVSDDGKGIDGKALLAKGIMQGLISSAATSTDKEVLDLIFHPGMSTSKKINEVSGRGVGMDVVHSSIRKLKGTVSVSSHPETGTTLTLTLPLTLSIIDGLLVQSGDSRFIIPLLQVEECVDLYDSGMFLESDRHVYSFRGQLIPFIRLREFYDLDDMLPKREQIVIVRIKKEFLGLVVDYIIGDHQTVIKSLGWVYRKAPGLSGATILGDGQVALILDIAGVYHYAMIEEPCMV